ncbi:MAG: DUF6879 family protein [Acidimicrobiia bacterium]
MDLDAVIAYFDAHFTRTAFRLEVMDYYDVESDGDEYRRYLAGEEPDHDFKEPWLRVLRTEHAAGKLRHRVRVLTRPLNDYLRYECEWGYAPNSEAGEDIRVLDLSEQPRPAELIDEEFWLLDDNQVLQMRYDDTGKFVGAELADDPARYRAARDAAIRAAEPFGAWWARHPEEHRRSWLTTAK